MDKKMVVAVLYGGDGPEKEVSLKSGEAVSKGLEECGYKVVPFKVHSLADVFQLRNVQGLASVFVALHGGWGEDGRVQAALEAMNFPYTGPGPLACSLSMDKAAAKGLLNLYGIPTPAGLLVLKNSSFSIEESRHFIATHKMAILKPCNGGSTIGVSVVKDASSLEQAFEEAWRYDDRAVLEEFISGVDVTVAVWERKGSPEALPAVMIRPKQGFYDYDSKYTPGMTEYITPAPYEPKVSEHLAHLACQAFQVLGCEGYARVDFRVEEDGTPWVLEVNTVPGMTSTSLVPKAAAAAGYDFPLFLSELVQLSFEKKSACK
ncbi:MULTISPECIES: D-alanine--D-alanine ligase family protein [Aminobacterium]|uniref:D-alanine--D-alanine ligase family protein n=1 Tax=Aminobacterium TaxID=81466 RepID=UPI0004B05CB3|nr:MULTISPECIES: D-alanine--D-alanine ligase [Aminobacterium]